MSHREKISHTAWLVMLCQIGLATHPRWQVLGSAKHADFYRSVYAYCRRNFTLYQIIHVLIPLDFHLWLIEKLLTFGAPQHVVLRKQAIARQVEDCIKHGAGQVVVVGGGFDVLAVSMAQAYPNVTFIEIDTPDMHTHKLQIARDVFKILPANFVGLGVDLSTKSLFDALSACPAFSTSKYTIFVVEGVMMYLPEQAVRQSFADMRRLAKDVAIIFTAIETDCKPQSSGWAGLQRFILTQRGERFAWSLPRTQMPDFMNSLGFAQQSQIGYAELQAAWRTKDELEILNRQHGEYVVYATGR